MHKQVAIRACATMLFLAVLLGVRLSGFFGVVPRISMMPMRRVRMVRCLLVMPSLVMLGRFSVVSGGMAVMFCRLLVMFCR
jgi:hypothetical protein